MSHAKKSRSRREFASISVIALAWASLGAQVVSAQTPASDLESEFLLELVLDVDAQIDAGHTRIAPVTGGTFGGVSRCLARLCTTFSVYSESVRCRSAPGGSKPGLPFMPTPLA